MCNQVQRQSFLRQKLCDVTAAIAVEACYPLFVHFLLAVTDNSRFHQQ